MSNVGAGASERSYVSAVGEWGAYDSLPSSVRRGLQSMHMPYAAMDVLAVFHAEIRERGVIGATDAVRLGIAWNEAVEIANFSRAHKAKHGTPLPHVAAGATICRPDSAVRRRPILGAMRLSAPRGRRRRAT